jgi:AbrB family looped-hinge helix DNA binding protein
MMAYGIINTMKITIDATGRIVLPKPLRDRFRLTAGATLELEERPEGLVLRPVEQSPAIVRRDGLWVYVGKVPTGFRWDNIVDDDREKRIQDLSGL